MTEESELGSQIQMKTHKCGLSEAPDSKTRKLLPTYCDVSGFLDDDERWGPNTDETGEESGVLAGNSDRELLWADAHQRWMTVIGCARRHIPSNRINGPGCTPADKTFVQPRRYNNVVLTVEGNGSLELSFPASKTTPDRVLGQSSPHSSCEKILRCLRPPVVFR